MDRGEIVEEIFLIIKNLNHNVSVVKIDDIEKKGFFGKDLGLQPRDLIYLLDEMCIRYDKEILPATISKYGFKRVGDLANFIMES